jgi:hypothetical protein
VIRRAAAFLVVVLLAGLACDAAIGGAEHELYYRYVVVGFVKDAKGRAVGGRTLELIRDKTGFTYLADTDEKGFYVIVARLGDEGEGESLTLRIGGRSTTLIAHFIPSNHTEDRGTRVDVENDKFVERPASFRSTLANFLGAAGRQ